MSELRQNIATKEWYVIASDRAKRPKDFKHKKPQREDFAHSEKCPFCPGNEHKTPPAHYVLEHDGKWLVRVVDNKFPAFKPEGGRKRTVEGIYRKMDGVGYHEVIIESSLHNDHYTKMSLPHLESIIQTYLLRYKKAMEDERIEAVILFKNYGPSAGCSLAHPHAQMIAIPVVPLHMRGRLDNAKRYCDDTGNCVFCVMMNDEDKERVRVVTENDSFIAFCPYASGAPFETWIMPRRHEPDFRNITDSEIKDLAWIMKDLFSKYYFGLNDPDFNFAIKSPPRDESNDRSFHWYIKVMPKISKVAGFEMGSGMYINCTLPELNAEFLRNVEVPATV
ncbi:MAG: galactose-1-phosphate uridylyltransferase [Candidatus Eremiobacteraeota bacterium]|nr:galactose-1-phosphate uridylyltransferase [Candidatus Eremiobacteraeota bacterium]